MNAMEWLFLLPLVAAGLAGGWLSYRLRFAPLMRSLEAHLREEAAERQAKRLRCWCEDCDLKAHGGLRSKMSVCPDCGDKRCSRAAHHDLPCSKPPNLEVS
jgi:hypothetical protein